MTEEERKRLRKYADHDVVYGPREFGYMSPEHDKAYKNHEPLEYASWEDFLECTEKSPDWYMKS